MGMITHDFWNNFIEFFAHARNSTYQKNPTDYNTSLPQTPQDIHPVAPCCPIRGAVRRFLSAAACEQVASALATVKCVACLGQAWPASQKAQGERQKRMSCMPARI